MLCGMGKMLKNSAGWLGELWGANVRWVVLAPVCLAAVLWLATACGPRHYEDFNPLAHDGDWDGECVAYLIEEGEITVTTEDAGSEVDRPTSEHVSYVLEKYRPLFRRFPHQWGNGRGLLYDTNGKLTHEVGIKVYVEELVEQSTLSTEDRIPDCLEGVPVQIVVEENTVTFGSLEGLVEGRG